MNKNSSLKKLVILDFCETLVKFQTSDKFIDFVCADKNKFLHKFISFTQGFLTRFKILSVIYKILPKYNFNKRLKLLSISGIHKDYLKLKANSYNIILLDNIVSSIETILHDSLKNDDIVIIVSGGYETYLSKFTHSLKIKHFIGTKIMYKNNKATGLIDGLDCMFENKIILLEDYIKRNGIVFNNSVLYSDSISDISLFNWADEGYVVSKNYSQKWCQSLNLNEIIWND